MPSETPPRLAGGPQRTSLAQQFLGLFSLLLNAGPRSHRHTSRRASRDAQRRKQQQRWASRTGDRSMQAPLDGSAVGVSSDRSLRSVHSATSDPSTPTTLAPNPDLPADLAKSADTTAAKPVPTRKTKTSLKQRLLRLVTCGGGKADSDSCIEETQVTAFVDEEAPKETPVLDIRKEESSPTVIPADTKRIVKAAEPKTTRALKKPVPPPTSASHPPRTLKASRCIIEDDMVVEDFDEADFLLPSTSVSMPVTSAESLPSTPVPPPEPEAKPLPPMADTPVPWKVDPSPPVAPAPVDPVPKRSETPLRSRPRPPSVRPTEARLLPSIAATPLPAWKQWQVKHLYQMSLVNMAPRQQRRRGRTVSWDLDGVGTQQKNNGRRRRKYKKNPKVTPPTADTTVQRKRAAMLEARDTEAAKRRQDILNDRKFAMEMRREQYEKNERRRQRKHAEQAAKLQEKLERAESRRQELQDGVVQRCQSRLERVKSRCASRSATPTTLQATDTDCTTTSPDATSCSTAPTLVTSSTATPFDNMSQRPVSVFNDDEDFDVSLPPTPASSPRDEPEALQPKSTDHDASQRTKSKSEGCFISTQRSPNTKQNKSDGCVLQDEKTSLGAVGGIPLENGVGTTNKLGNNFLKVYDVDDDWDFDYDLPARPKTYTLVREDDRGVDEDEKARKTNNAKAGGRPKPLQAW